MKENAKKDEGGEQGHQSLTQQVHTYIYSNSSLKRLGVCVRVVLYYIKALFVDSLFPDRVVRTK